MTTNYNEVESVQTCSFSGTVQHQISQNGIPGIELELMSSGSAKALQTSTTDKDGRFEFLAVSPGRYDVLISTEHSSKYDFALVQRFV